MGLPDWRYLRDSWGVSEADTDSKPRWHRGQFYQGRQSGSDLGGVTVK